VEGAPSRSHADLVVRHLVVRHLVVRHLVVRHLVVRHLVVRLGQRAPDGSGGSRISCGGAGRG
jgi:hypothetical protein